MSREAEIISALSGLQGQQRELLVLAELSGIQADSAVYQIIIELLNMQIEPDAIYKLLRYIKRSSKLSKHSSRNLNNLQK